MQEAGHTKRALELWSVFPRGLKIDSLAIALLARTDHGLDACEHVFTAAADRFKEQYLDDWQCYEWQFGYKVLRKDAQNSRFDYLPPSVLRGTLEAHALYND